MAGLFMDGSSSHSFDAHTQFCTCSGKLVDYLSLSEDLFSCALKLYFHWDLCWLSWFAVRTSSFNLTVQTHTLLFHFSYISLSFTWDWLLFFKLRYNSYSWKLMHSECTIQSFLRIHSAVWLLPLFNFAYFHHPLTRETPTPCSLCTPVFLLSAWL